MNAEDRNNHFMYYMRSLLKQLQTMFPECIATAILSEKLANDNSAAGSKDLVEKWQQYMGDSETDVAIRTKDVAKVLDNNNPIMTMLSIKAKYGDPRLTENSRRVLWQFIEKLHTLAVQDTRLQGIVDISLPPPPSTEFTIPPEMSPLIDLAKSFMQKIPEDDLEQMYGSIAAISQNVLKNYEGQLPPEFGGDYFSKVLRETFKQ